jgi:hypothetical protein
MLSSFQVIQLFARERVSELQREAERDRLAKRVAAHQFGNGASLGLRPSMARREAPLPTFLQAFLPWRATPARMAGHSDKGEDDGSCCEPAS